MDDAVHDVRLRKENDDLLGTVVTMPIADPAVLLQ